MFWHGGDTLRIVTPDADVVRAEVARLAPERIRVVIHTDDEVSSALKMRHWCRQQVLKLAAHKIVASDFYLVLDADCFFVRPTTEHDLVQDGRGRVSYGKGRAYSQGRWYTGCRRLGVAVPSNAVNMTPFVMHRELAADALGFVQDRLGSIVTLGWSEYTLYHSLAVQNGTWDAHHYEGEPLLGNEVWTGGRALTGWDVAKCFAPGNFPLSLVQSSTHVPAEWVWSRVREYIDTARQL